MTTASVEIERKYDVDVSAHVPDLLDVTGVSSVPPAEVHELVATYFDTAGLRLRQAGITLRHRSGGDDGGWHLKVPLGEDREELHLAGDDPTAPVPQELRALVRSVARSQPLDPVARLTTRRTVRHLLDAAGTALADVVDDEVEGNVLPDGATAPLRWREWEAELGSADRSLLTEIEDRLLSAGALPSGAGSKVGRVLDGRRDDAEEPWWAATGTAAATRRSSAAEAVRAHLREQVSEVVSRDPQVRRDLPDAVHKMRVATRRLRSALKTFRVLDRAVTDPLRDELRWLAGVLGGARDAEVMHARLRTLVAAEPPELVLGPVQRRIDLVMDRRYRSAHDDVVATLDGDRYLRLLDALDDLVGAPPFDDRASGRARDVLPALVRKTWKRLDRTLREAERAEPGSAQDLLLHEARKDAKAARYAAESVVPVFGGDAKRLATAMEDLQEVLGEHQDGVVTREVLRQLGAGATRSGENGFTFGRLHALEQARAEAADVRWPRVRKRISRPRLRRWLEV